MDIAVPRKMVTGAAAFLALVAAAGLYLGMKGSLEHGFSSDADTPAASGGQPTATATTASVEAKALTPESSAPAASSAPAKSSAPPASSAVASSDDQDDSADNAPAKPAARAQAPRPTAPTPDAAPAPETPPAPQRPAQPQAEDLPPF